MLATAPALLPSALGENVAKWCGALVEAGRFADAVTVAESAEDFAGGRVEALLATAIAARGDRGEEVDELMKKAASEAKAFKPAFSIGLRLKVATSLIEFEQAHTG